MSTAHPPPLPRAANIQAEAEGGGETAGTLAGALAALRRGPLGMDGTWSALAYLNSVTLIVGDYY